jgi:hypothetical protein
MLGLGFTGKEVRVPSVLGLLCAFAYNGVAGLLP